MEVDFRNFVPSLESVLLTFHPHRMYFWSITQLKMEMVARPYSDSDILPYLIGSVAVTSVFTALGCIPNPTFNMWDGLTAAWSVVLAVAGAIYIYRQNGAAKGQQFLQRYFAIGWVVAWRWTVAFSIVAIAFYSMLEAFGFSWESTGWHHLLFVAIAEVLLYWRFGHHVRDVARRTAHGFRASASAVDPEIAP